MVDSIDTRQIIIDYDKLAEIGIKGVRRAAVFLGLGLNAAYDPELKNYQLRSVHGVEQGSVRMELVPDTVSQETLDHFKVEFATWIIASGLREVIERFAIFLDGVNRVSQHIACTKKELEPAVAAQRDRSFRQRGIEYNFQKLSSRFGIEFKHSEHVISINQARNCLTHRLGKVGSEDCGGGQDLEAKWLGMDLDFVAESGEITKLTSPLNMLVEGPGRIQVRVVERVRAFSLGTFVRFQLWELAEICKFILDSVEGVKVSAIDYANRMGIQRK